MSYAKFDQHLSFIYFYIISEKMAPNCGQTSLQSADPHDSTRCTAAPEQHSVDDVPRLPVHTPLAPVTDDEVCVEQENLTALRRHRRPHVARSNALLRTVLAASIGKAKQLTSMERNLRQRVGVRNTLKLCLVEVRSLRMRKYKD